MAQAEAIINTGKSVFAAITFHAMSNVGVYLYPNQGSYYDPFITGVLIIAAAAVVVFLWGPRTLARFRFARWSERTGNGFRRLPQGIFSTSSSRTAVPFQRLVWSHAVF